jgi:hypothetical protein
MSEMFDEMLSISKASSKNVNISHGALAADTRILPRQCTRRSYLLASATRVGGQSV